MNFNVAKQVDNFEIESEKLNNNIKIGYSEQLKTNYFLAFLLFLFIAPVVFIMGTLHIMFSFSPLTTTFLSLILYYLFIELLGVRNFSDSVYYLFTGDNRLIKFSENDDEIISEIDLEEDFNVEYYKDRVEFHSEDTKVSIPFEDSKQILEIQDNIQNFYL